MQNEYAQGPPADHDTRGLWDKTTNSVEDQMVESHPIPSELFYKTLPRISLLLIHRLVSKPLRSVHEDHMMTKHKWFINFFHYKAGRKIFTLKTTDGMLPP